MDYGQVILKSGKDQSVKRYHPWIFSGAIKETLGDFREGDVVQVFNNKEEFLGLGIPCLPSTIRAAPVCLIMLL